MMPAHPSPFSLPAQTELVTRFAYEVHASLDLIQVAQTAFTVFQEIFQPELLVLYQAEPATQTLRLLASRPRRNQKAPGYLPFLLSFHASSLLARSSQERGPLLITDMQDPVLRAALPVGDELQTAFTSETRGCICLPLWRGCTFEGNLLATFPEPFFLTEQAVQILNCYALHLATALSSARLHLVVQEERFRQRAVLDQLPDGILITEATSGVISYANHAAARILDIPLSELIGLALCTSMVATPYQTEHFGPRFPWAFAVIRALSGETVNQAQAVAVRPNGAHIPLICSSTPLQGEQGVITGAILVFQDIIEHQDLEFQKTLFFSFASHELRTPLTAIMGYAELLSQVAKNEQLDLPALRLAAQHIYVQAEQMAYLIDEMLDLAHVDQKSLNVHLAPVDFLPLARRVVENIASTTHKHYFRLLGEEWQHTATQFLILADTIQITRALNSLLNNAIKYSPHGGTIEVGVRQQTPSTHLLFWVKDYGLGISPEDLPHIFTRFYRVKNLDSAISGLGIGLYLVKKIVELLGGRVWAESIAGQGSTFYLELPLAQ